MNQQRTDGWTDVSQKQSNILSVSIHYKEVLLVLIAKHITVTCCALTSDFVSLTISRRY